MLKSEVTTRIRLISGLILFFTFSAGVLVGAGVDRYFRPHRMGPPILRLPLGELELTPDQDARVRAIIDAHRAELEGIVRSSFPRVRAIHERIDAEVRAILTPEQRRRLDEIQARRPPPRLAPPGMPGGYPPPLPPPPPPPEQHFDTH